MIAGRIDTTFARSFLKTKHVGFPVQPQESAQTARFIFYIIHERFIANKMHSLSEALHRVNTRAHDRSIIACGAIECKKIQHGFIKPKSAHEARQHHVTWITYFKNEACLGEQSHDEWHENLVERQLVHEYLPGITLRQ